MVVLDHETVLWTSKGDYIEALFFLEMELCGKKMKETTPGKEKLGVNEKYATLAPDRFVAKSQDMIYHHLAYIF